MVSVELTCLMIPIFGPENYKYVWVGAPLLAPAFFEVKQLAAAFVNNGDSATMEFQAQGSPTPTTQIHLLPLHYNVV